MGNEQEMDDGFRWHGYDTADIYAAQDQCLIAIQNGTQIPVSVIQRIPPDRASLIATVAEKAGIPLERGTHEQLRAQAALAGSRGKLSEWWRK